MFGPIKWMFLSMVTILAQDPRKRMLFCQSHETQGTKFERENFICNDPDGKCITKRFASEDIGAGGPFWANRGKKDPVYVREPLYAEEPNWLLIRGENGYQEDPFFLSRGKKETGSLDTRELIDNDSPFFAARGKRFKIKH